jgi:predicted transcriptional regulator
MLDVTDEQGGKGHQERRAMRIEKQQLRSLIEELPEESVEMDEVLYRLYLLGKLEAAEEDVRAGRVLTQEEVEAETAKWFSE